MVLRSLLERQAKEFGRWQEHIVGFVERFKCSCVVSFFDGVLFFNDVVVIDGDSELS